MGPWAPIQLGNDLVHLVASAIWPGGLIPLLLCLNRNLPPPIKETVLIRFSDLSVVTVAIIGCTGVFNAWFRLHDLSQVITTTYGSYVLLKWAGFCLLIAFGAINRLKLIPRLKGTGWNDSPAENWRALRRNILIEQVLFAIVLVVVARLGVLSPPHPG